MRNPDYDSATDPRNPDNHAEHQFCTDPQCQDKEDQDEIALLGAFYDEGLVSASDADNIYHGRTL